VIAPPGGGTWHLAKRFCQNRFRKDRTVRDIASTATFVASIAIVIALMLMAPKSFGFESSRPIVQGEISAP
jgi:hypothetical protein